MALQSAGIVQTVIRGVGREMKVLIGAIALVILMIGAPSVYAQVIHSKHPQADFRSGYYHGVVDATDLCKQCPNYLFQPGNGFINQTNDFIDGYVIGFCSISGPNSGVDEDEADFDCNEGPSSAGWMVGPTVRSGGMDFTSKFPSRNLPN